jgi:drug/metabolite transporter (DMT)-like permease
MLELKTSIFLKILSSLFFLGSGIIWKKILIDERKNYHFIFFRVIATLFFISTIAVTLNFFGIDFFKPIDTTIISIKDWIICISICLFSFWGLYFYTNALQVGRYSVAAPLVVISSAFSFLTSLMLYDETLSNSKYIALAFILVGLLLHQKDLLRQFQMSKEVVLVILFSLFWGISFVFYLIPIKKFGVLFFSIILEICVLISCVGLLIFKEKRLWPPKVGRRSSFFCLLMGFLVAGGTLLSNFTLTQFPVSLNILIGLLFELITVAVGLYYFKEKLYPKDYILIVFASVGGFLLLL